MVIYSVICTIMVFPSDFSSFRSQFCQFITMSHQHLHTVPVAVQFTIQLTVLTNLLITYRIIFLITGWLKSISPCWGYKEKSSVVTILLPPVLWVSRIDQQVEWKTPPTLAPLPASLLYSATAFSVCSTVTSTPVCFTNSSVVEGTWWNKGGHSISPSEPGRRHPSS